MSDKERMSDRERLKVIKNIIDRHLNEGVTIKELEDLTYTISIVEDLTEKYDYREEDNE